MLLKQTKIVASISDRRCDVDFIKQLFDAGMNVVRMNTAHASREGFEALIANVRAVSNRIAILMDTKGPEVRTTANAEPIPYQIGERVKIVGNPDLETTRECIAVSYPNFVRDLNVGGTILIDDGDLELRVIDKTDDYLICEVQNEATLGSRKSVNVPGVRINLPSLTEKDRNNILYAIEKDIDFIAHSFVRNRQDVLDIREILDAHNSDIKIIAKIENQDGVENIDEIINVADGIMVARGDLGVEIPLEEIPIIQKELIKKAYNAGLQVITATQMLDSMMKNPRPTRAESTDVANAIYDGTSAIMLSGETAAGSYPVIALQTMARIAERTEEDIDYVSRFQKRDVYERPNVTSAISHATCTTAHDLGAVAIMGVSKSGKTARMISKYRPKCPIICGTTDAMVWRQMNLSWGVTPIMIEEKTNTDELFEHVVSVASSLNLVNSGDLVVITAGVPLGVSGTTNLLKVHLVGDALVSGIGVNNASICGNLCVCATEEEALKSFKPGDILVVPQTSNRLLDILKDCSGIITETPGINSHAAIVGLALDLPVLVGAENATKLLKSGTTVTLDCQRGIVFSGTSHHLPRPNR